MIQQSNNAFSIRRLNPFNGSLQVLLSDTARALSSNGTLWELQVLSDKPQGLWANMPYSGQQFYTFGRWTLSQGLQQVPINPLFNVRDMIASAEQLIEALQNVLGHLPFPPADHFELWQLDHQQQRPIALLLSCRDEREMARFDTPKWIAAARGDFSFVSQSLLDQGVPANDGYNPRAHASVLEALVRERGGQHPQSAWFFRHPDGSATPCNDFETRLEAGYFPELPVSEDWPEQRDSQLIQDYLNWKSPQLLLLPGLSLETRSRLELLAVKQAEAIERLWRLYPEIHNKDLLNSARVEARIRAANRN
jgi:hypothetical protein